jgi:hypothetical protein
MPRSRSRALHTLATDRQMLATEALEAMHCGAEAEVAMHDGDFRLAAQKLRQAVRHWRRANSRIAVPDLPGPMKPSAHPAAAQALRQATPPTRARPINDSAKVPGSGTARTAGTETGPCPAYTYPVW